MTPSIWKELRLVESFDVDPKGRLKPHKLFSFMINSAWNHASALGLGYQELSEHNLMWVISKFQLNIIRMPEWRDKISIETWGKSIERFYALRDFSVFSEEGRKLAYASGGWLILEKDSYRPQKLDQLMANFPWQKEKSELETNLKKVAESTKSEDRIHFHVVFTDIDINNHVNGAKYLQWIMDSYPRDVLEQMQPESIEMSFLAEAAIDDEIAVHFERLANQEINTVRRVIDSKDLCRAAVKWHI